MLNQQNIIVKPTAIRLFNWQNRLLNWKIDLRNSQKIVDLTKSLLIFWKQQIFCEFLKPIRQFNNLFSLITIFSV